MINQLQCEREQNRKNFPTAAKLMDAFKVFSPRMIYAEEIGKKIGKEHQVREISRMKGFVIGEAI